MSNLDRALAWAALGCFVFPARVAIDKRPAIKGWQTWANRDEGRIRAHWTRRPDHRVAVFTGRLGDDGALLVVDVDMKTTKNGEASLLKLELEGLDLPATLRQNTPSGGHHLYFKTPVAVRSTVERLGPGLDIRSGGGYVITYEMPVGTIAQAPQALVELCGVPAKARKATAVRGHRPDLDIKRAVKRAKQYLLDEAPLAIENSGGDATTFKVAARLKDFGLDAENALDAMIEHWNERCSPPWPAEALLRKITNAFAYGKEAPGAAAPETDFDPVVAPVEAPPEMNGVQHPLAVLNKEFAFVVAGGGDHILWETTDEHGLWRLEHLNLGAFHRRLEFMTLQIGKREIPLTEEWMKWAGRRSFDGLVFRPGLPTPQRFYNLWRGFAVEPWPKDKTPPALATAGLAAFLEHALLNICQGDKILNHWLLGWFAHMVQRPWEKPLTAVVFHGGEGVGKNVFIEAIGHLLGPHFLVADDVRYLVGNFNGHLERLLFMTLDEVTWGGDKRAEGKLKGLITGSRHTIEHKGEKVYAVDNLLRLAILGNEEWLVPAAHDARRFAVFEVGEGRKQDGEFFGKMLAGLTVGGYRLLLRFLQEYDLRGLNLNVAPATDALLAQKTATLDPVYDWWLASLMAGRLVSLDFGEGWIVDVDCAKARDAFRRYAQDRNIRSRLPDERILGKMLRKACPSMTRRRGRAGYTYTMPALAAARADWSRWIGQAVNWEEGST